ncbi:MAG: SDR family NAD(P)-dependent oxidoreductase [Acidimicrobiales bacterium]|nr:SDR family NAD(P)-dependent oxidoreductase [Acidimicrobiales bacterium]
MHLDGVDALVTGGSSGLGAATAQRLASAGSRVTTIDLRGEPPVDVCDPDAVAAVVDRLGELRVLVCCAGVPAAGHRTVRRQGPHDLDVFERIVRVNLIGTFNCVRLAAWAMSRLEPVDDAGERGVIVTTSSIAAFDGVTGGAAYSAAKAGVAGMTLPVARDLAPLGIRVVSIAPGSFATPMVASMPPAYADQLAAETPFPHRFGQPGEFAALAQHVVENTMLNGTVIRLDGALRMR